MHELTITQYNLKKLNSTQFICDKNTGQQSWISELTATLKRNKND